MMKRIINNPFIVTILFIFMGILIYSNTFQAPFHYDDYDQIVENPDIKWNELSWDNFKRLFKDEYSRPISLLTFALNYSFGGLDVSGYHYVNIGIHIISAFGFYLFLSTIFGLPHFDRKIRDNNRRLAVISSILWLSSPVHIQAVTYIVQRMAALAAMFYIYAMYFYLKGRLSLNSKSYLFYILAMSFALLALGSKQNAVTLPFFLLVLEILVIKKGNAAFLFKKKRGFAILSVLGIIFCGLIYLYLPLFKDITKPWFLYAVESRFLTGTRVILFYVIQLLFPVPSRLSLEHDFQASRSLFDPPATIVALLLLTGIVIYTLASLKRRPIFSFFALWFLGNLVIETFNPYLVTAFEHRLYLPAMGFFALAGIWINNLITSMNNRLRGFYLLALLIVVALFSINTYIRNNVWKDPYTLWFDVIKKSPNISIGYMQLGVTYFKDEDYDGALNSYLKARSIAPRDPSVRYGLGVIYFNLQEYEEAIREFNHVGSLGYMKPNKTSPDISYYLSRIARNYYGHGRVEEAIKVIDNALLYDPDEPMLKELKEKMVKGTITAKEIMSK